MTGVKLPIAGIRSHHFTNCVTSTAHILKYFFQLNRTENQEHILFSEYDLNMNEWRRFDWTLAAIEADSYLIFETMVFTDDAGNVKDNVNIAIDDVTFTPQCM